MKKLFIFSSLLFFTNFLFAQTIEKTDPAGNGTGGGIVPKLSDISDYKHTVISLGGSSNGILSKSTSSYSVIDIDAPTGLNSLLRLGKAGIGKWTVYNNGFAGNDNFGIYEYAVAERFTIAKTTGLVGIGVTAPAARLHVAGGVWDVATTEGDFKIGDATYRLKIGVATGGGGAGDARIFASGGTNRIIFGTGTTDQAALFGANFGIGTIAPTAKFHIFHDTEADDTKPHIKITQTFNGDNGRIRMENADGSTYFMNSFYPASGSPATDYIRWTHSSGGESLRLKGNGNAVITGFTQLGGNSAPAIKTKLITGTTAATVSTNATVAHGLDATKIISITAIVQYNTAGNYVLAGNEFAGWQFDFDSNATNVIIYNQASSGNILSKPFRVLITYTE